MNGPWPWPAPVIGAPQSKCRVGTGAWAGMAVREVLCRRLYIGQVVWGATRRDGTPDGRQVLRAGRAVAGKPVPVLGVPPVRPLWGGDGRWEADLQPAPGLVCVLLSPQARSHSVPERGRVPRGGTRCGPPLANRGHGPHARGACRRLGEGRGGHPPERRPGPGADRGIPAAASGHATEDHPAGLRPLRMGSHPRASSASGHPILSHRGVTQGEPPPRTWSLAHHPSIGDSSAGTRTRR